MSGNSLADSLGLHPASIDATILRDMLIEAYEEAREKHRAAQPDMVLVSAAMALLKTTGGHPGRDVPYHREGCQKFLGMNVPDVLISRELALSLGFIECKFCADLSIRGWCRTLDVEPTQVWQIMTKHHLHVRKSIAVRLFRAIGEQPHPSLLKDAS